MNRELKFRVWNNNIITSDGKLGTMLEWYQLKNNFLMHRNDGGFHIMQFTGLTDKNGKEIYEWDVVKTPDEDLRKVVYCHNSFEMRLLNGNIDSNQTVWYFNTEIVGNVFENQELLKHEK